MALIQATFMSNTLKRTVPIQVILPVDKLIGEEMKPFKTLYLLHGLFGSYHDWNSNTRIQRWAQDQNLAVVMPSADNSFYIDYDMLPNSDYGKFIGEELVQVTRAMFHLSDKREDTFIAGLSMGGFWAIRNGLKYSETFGYIAGLSSAIQFFEFPGHTIIDEDKVFGDLEKAILTDKNPRYLIENFGNKPKPKIFMACGLEDSLIEANRIFKDLFIKHGFDLTYIEDHGKHDWDFWDKYIQDILKWLPLDERKEGLSSGHVQED